MSGPGDDYSQDEIDEVYDALGDAFDLSGAFDMAEVRKGITVTARIEWAGEYANNGRNGERTVQLDTMNLTSVRDGLRNAQRLEGLAARGPLRSYTAKGWEAQFHHLNSTKRGREALQAAGWNPSRETLRRYGKGEQIPLKSNRAKLAEAYDNARNPGRGWVEARNAAVGEFTTALQQQYGSTVRFRDIVDLRLT
jgi:hypothetical protein